MAVGALVCSAGPITFTEAITTSGSLDGTAFTNQLVTITLTGNTSSITNPSSGLYFLNGPASVTVATVGSDTFTDTMAAAENQSSHAVGITDTTTSLTLLWTANAALSTYDLSASIGPLSGGSLGNAGTAFATTGGSFTITGALNVDHPSTFTAAVSGVPEPGTLALLGIGVGLLAFGKRLLR